MKSGIILLCIVVSVSATAQQNKELGVAVTNSNSAFPFSKFCGEIFNAFYFGWRYNKLVAIYT